MKKFTASLLLIFLTHMTVVEASDFNRQFFGYDPVMNVGASLTLSTTALISANNRYAVVFQARSTEAITTITTCSSAAAGTTAKYRVSVQGVDASGLPDGTILGGGSPAELDNIASSTWGSNTCVAHTLTNATPALTPGAFYSIVIDPAATGTFDASNLVTFIYGANAIRGTGGIPYPLLDANLTWAVGDKQSIEPVFGANGSTVYYGRPIYSQSTTTYSGTTEVGARFTTDSGWASTLGVCGVRWTGTTPSASQTVYVTLYSGGDAGSPTVIETLSMDGDIAAAASSVRSVYEIYFAATHNITAGTTYHVGLAASGGSPTLNWTDYISANSMKGAYTQGSVTYVTRTITAAPPVGEVNAFTNTTTRRPWMALILCDMTKPAGGGTTTYVGVIGG